MAAFDPETLLHQKLDHYEVEKVLRIGGVSTLYRAYSGRSEQRVYLEVLHSTRDESPELAGRFQRRMELVSQLSHPHIAPVLFVGTNAANGRPYAVIEYASARTLSDQVASWRQQPPPMEVGQALQLVRQLADALAVAHPAGIVHHDLQPKNILLRDDHSPMLVDLGVLVTPLARDESILRQEGCLDYASPEQLRGQALTGRSNIYSLGIMLYEMLAGERPPLPLSNWNIFEGRALPKELPLEELRPGLMAETYYLVKNCLWQQDWNRFDAIQHMIAALDAAQAAEKEAALAPPQRGRRRWPLYAGLVLLLIIIVAAAIFLWWP